MNDRNEYTLPGRDIDVAETCFEDSKLDDRGGPVSIVLLFRRKHGYDRERWRERFDDIPQRDAIEFVSDDDATAAEKMAVWLDSQGVQVPEVA